MPPAIFQDNPAQVVLPHHARRHQRKRRLEPRQINQDIIRRAAGALGLGADIGQLIALGIDINHFDLVNDPIARGQQAATRRRR